ncbi:MAG: sulfur carrier protein ThiS [Lachnospiraceae bacterium]|nr:sulfur carrier protein ThiS [Lachnospiraceae bacterium]
MVRINGEEKKVQGMKLTEYLEAEGYRQETIAIECNEEILSKSEYDKKILQDGDVLEIVNFVGGGR